MPKLSGVFPKNPGEAAPGMKPKEHDLHQGFIASMIHGVAESTGQAPEGPQNGPSSPGR